MTTFDDRERAFENRFAHDLELTFRAQARRNYQIGLWAAHRLGRSGDEAEAYALLVLKASVDRDGADAVVTKLRGDLSQHGVSISEHQIRRRMDELLAEAVEYVKTH